MKAAISIEESLLERIDALARQLRLSRSQLIARALGDLLDRHENRSLLDAINRALEGEPDAAEGERLVEMRRIQRERIEGEW